MTTSAHTSPSGGKELPAGTRLEEFVIERVLGSGGFGITYLARDTSLNRQVVIKENLPSQFAHRDTTSLTVHPGPGREDQENFRWSLENFSREGEMLASLRHPGIVPVLRRFDAFGTAYFVMPFVEGVPLDQLIEERLRENKPFSEQELRDLLEHVLAALDHLHQRGIYHRDIKPGNLLITNDGIPVLIDFGSARQRLGERSMTVIESPGYTPFEQLQSRGNVGPWSDLYALGGTLEKAIVGQAPPKAMDRMRRDPRLPLAERRDLHDTYTPTFLGTIDKSLKIEESERWQDAGEWVVGLRKESGQEGAASLLPPPASVPKSEPVPAPGSSSPKVVNGPKRSRKPVPWIIAACLVLGFIGLAKTCSNKKPDSLPVTAVGDAVMDGEWEKSEPVKADAREAEVRAAKAERERQAKEDDAQTKKQQEEQRFEEQATAKEAEAKQQRLAELAKARAPKGQPFVNSLGMKFVPVKITGGPSSGQQALFSIWETRVQDYRKCAASKSGVDGAWESPYFKQGEDHPVVKVSWEDAVAFCQWLTQQEQSAGKIPATARYRLPTDHEWSCASGIGEREDADATPMNNHDKIGEVYPWGTQWPPPVNAGNYAASLKVDSYEYTSPVGSFKANGNGIHDLGGNVWEWCEDQYDGNGSSRVVRGGSWHGFGREYLRSGCRDCGVDPHSRVGTYGFRVVLVMPNEPFEIRMNPTAQPETPITSNPVLDSGEAQQREAEPTRKEEQAKALEAFALIPAGSFMMGDAFQDGDPDELPVHKVEVSAFHIGKYEVTKALWDKVRAWGLEHGYNDLPEGKGKADDHPVYLINWDDIVKWCNARSEKDGLTPCYMTGVEVYKTGTGTPTCNGSANGYRLPTEAEWEKAARGGLSEKRFPWGNEISHSEANFNNQGNEFYQAETISHHPTYNEGTSPVGSFKANGYGLYDMAGSLWEMCSDWYSSKYYASSPEKNPQGPTTGSTRVLRGGSWFDFGRKCRTSERGLNAIPSDRFLTYGFRLARSAVTATPSSIATDQRGLSAIVPDSDTRKWETYTNDRFGFEFSYPETLKAEKSPTNGAGRTFSDGVFTVTAEAGFLGTQTFDQWWEERLKTMGKDVTYKVKKSTWAVVSGVRSDGVEFYMKRHVQGGNWAQFQAAYPHALNATYDPIIAGMAEKFIPFLDGDYDRTPSSPSE